MAFSYDEKNFKKLCKKYNLSLAILHGSYAKGMTSAKSDIDIGFLGDPKTIKRKYFEIIEDFSGIFGERFDPVFLNGAEAMILSRVALNGVLLYEKKKGFFNSFKVTAIARYNDTKKFRLLEKEYLRQIAQGKA